MGIYTDATTTPFFHTPTILELPLAGRRKEKNAV
jgi:hypothetical protein